MYKKKVCAVIVSYLPEDALLLNVQALIGQVDRIVVIDNTPDIENPLVLRNIESLGVMCIYNGANLGIATALNQGIKYAIDEGYEWVATFDQDSTATSNMIPNMFSIYDRVNNNEKVAMVAPSYQDELTGKISISANPISHDDFIENNIEIKPEVICALEVITSGALIKTKIFSEIGFYDEKYFIDYVDVEFCLRCVVHQYKIIQALNIFLIHNLGSLSIHNFFWRTITSTNHSSLRRYYIMRNRIYTYHKYFYRLPLWMFKDVKYVFIEFLKIILVEKEKGAKIKMMILGVLDAIAGREGRYLEKGSLKK